MSTTEQEQDTTIREYLDAKREEYGRDGPAPVDLRARAPQPVVSSSDAPTRPSISLDPGNITKLEGADDPDVSGYVSGAVNALEAAHKGVQAIIDAREAARIDPTLNEAGRVIRVGDYADKVSRRVTPMLDAATANLTKAINETDALLRQIDGNGTNPQLGMEIRTFVRGLSHGERDKFMREAMEARDTRTLSAVLTAPPYLAGLNAQMQEVYIQEFRRMQNPVAAKRLDVMRKALAKLEAAGPVFVTQTEAATGSRWAEISRLTKKKAQADKAFTV